MKTKWNKGPPPSIGWWPASCIKDKKILRFWNGDWWSDFCRQEAKPKHAGAVGKLRSIDQSLIYWTERWWV